MLLAFKPLLHKPFLWKKRKINNIIALIVLLVIASLVVRYLPLYHSTSPHPEWNIPCGEHWTLIFLLCARDVFLKDLTDFDTLIFCILRQVLDPPFRALSVTNTGDTSVYYPCCHLYQRLNWTWKCLCPDKSCRFIWTQAFFEYSLTAIFQQKGRSKTSPLFALCCMSQSNTPLNRLTASIFFSRATFA